MYLELAAAKQAENLGRIADALNRIADALASKPSAPPATAPVPSAPKEPTPPTGSYKPRDDAQAEQVPPTTYSRDDVNALLQKLAALDKKAAIALVNRLGHKKAGEIREDQFVEAYTDALAALQTGFPIEV